MPTVLPVSSAPMNAVFATKPGEFDPRKYNAEAQKAASKVCKARYEAFGTAGQADKIKPLPLEVVAADYVSGKLAQVVK